MDARFDALTNAGDRNTVLSDPPMQKSVTITVRQGEPDEPPEVPEAEWK